jgi:hypothetical protein
MIRPVREFSRFCIVASLSSVVVACGGEGAKSGAASTASASGSAGKCTKAAASGTYVAFKEYIKATTPTPQRFLSAAGTDSAAPEDGFRAMQDKGPSYFYGGDATAQKKIREKLASVGPYASLLIVHRGTTTSPTGDTMRVRLGGHYIGGEHEGQVATSRVAVVVCADSTWKLATMTEDAGK